VSGGTVKVEQSRFLSGKTRPAKARSTGPAPAHHGDRLRLQRHHRPRGRRVPVLGDQRQRDRRVVRCTSVSGGVTLTAGQQAALTITHPSGTIRYFNVYRSVAGGSLASARFIGRVAISTSTTTTFTDLGNKKPGFVTGVLVQGDTMGLKELASYSRAKLAQTDLSTPEAHFRFLTLALFQPRKNALIDNLVGTF
jgi:hypothetical protein